MLRVSPLGFAVCIGWVWWDRWLALPRDPLRIVLAELHAKRRVPGKYVRRVLVLPGAADAKRAVGFVRRRERPDTRVLTSASLVGKNEVCRAAVPERCATAGRWIWMPLGDLVRRVPLAGSCQDPQSAVDLLNPDSGAAPRLFWMEWRSCDDIFGRGARAP